MIVVGMPDGQLALQMFVAVVLPGLVGLVTTRLTPGAWKSSLLVILTIVASVTTELVKAVQVGTPFNVSQALMIAAGSYILSMAVHTGIMKPTKLADVLSGIGIKADPRLVELQEAGWAGPLPALEPAAEPTVSSVVKQSAPQHRAGQ